MIYIPTLHLILFLSLHWDIYHGKPVGNWLKKKWKSVFSISKLDQLDA